ncbi:MAG: hypothetical protein QOJ55_1434 [Solirubrobacteraceae bacterium]|jgi:hypothetical protein|nr:hypothetical protein [Solirubrobacteraceae bacterium]MDX6674499.1 hypothetical protein [Solirubrobacteraceae bacterium]
MKRFEVTLTERDLAPVDHPAASKCKCKCGDANGGAVPSAPDVRGSGEGSPHEQACLSPLGE